MEIAELKKEMKELKEEIVKELNKEEGKRSKKIIELAEAKLEDCHLRLQIIPLEKKMEELEDKIVKELNKEEGKRSKKIIELAEKQLENLSSRYNQLISAAPLPSSLHSSSSSPPPVLVDRVKALSELCKPMKAPSSYATSSEYTNHKFDLLHHHRPSYRTTFPITLSHPVFTRFVDRISSSSSSEMVLEREDFQFVIEVCNSMSNDYATEGNRTKAFTDLLNAFLGSEFHSHSLAKPDKNTQFHTDGSITTSLPHFKSINALLLNREDKNEKGQGGSDAYLQNAAYYCKWHNNMKELVNVSTCPSFLMELVGPAICISGAVYQDFISIDPLTPMLYLFFLPHNPLMTQLARVFKALKLGLIELKEYYEQLMPNPSSPPASLHFPYPTSFHSSHQTFHFSYSGKVTNGNGRVFEGEITQIDNNISMVNPFEYPYDFSKSSVGDEVIIKFVRQYGTAGHLLLSSHSPPLAPRLYSVSSVGAGWLMVVMEKIVNPKTLSENPPLVIRQSLLKAVSLLHSENLVHGDLRSNNLLVSRDETQLYLIDFDWCGKENEGVYPNFMNGVDIEWPNGASDGKKMMKEHDKQMLRRLVPDMTAEEESYLEVSGLTRLVSSIEVK
jgi:hypothetical protein